MAAPARPTAPRARHAALATRAYAFNLHEHAGAADMGFWLPDRAHVRTHCTRLLELRGCPAARYEESDGYLP